MINLEHLVTQQRIKQRVKKQANTLANRLIVDFDIHEGFQMAYFLTVSQGLDNFMAVRVWCERELLVLMACDDELLDEDSCFEHLRASFLSCFPQTLLESA